MKRQILFGTVLAAAMAVGVGAQTPDPSSPQTPQSPTSQSPTSQTPASPSMDRQSKSGDTVTLTGCVERNSASSTAGTTGTTSPSASASQFVLKNVTPSAGSSTSTTGTTGSTMASSYASGLYLSGSEDLEKHVNHKVEIKGKVDTAASASASSMPTLKVSSIKQIADTCSGGGQ